MIEEIKKWIDEYFVGYYQLVPKPFADYDAFWSNDYTEVFVYESQIGEGIYMIRLVNIEIIREMYFLACIPDTKDSFFNLLKAANIKP